jgi:hypothetical protein
MIIRAYSFVDFEFRFRFSPVFFLEVITKAEIHIDTNSSQYITLFFYVGIFSLQKLPQYIGIYKTRTLAL